MLLVPYNHVATLLSTFLQTKSAAICVAFCLPVGVPRIELGSYTPEAHILPLYYTPLETLALQNKSSVLLSKFYFYTSSFINS
ncbi:MAG: hypothetical protein UT41_C0003G0086 [Candidatus Wolfebacteria bacterium GW2011_GWC2_39_22]|uniref:Uncharacterized protein n=1 Tax=Candidatus Wolfebacteria bacterium GW2011_GWC2_39_22 TaxID=1619013 RepID=A0A0G0N7N6_9BACT|nr:MAG: hypothetical protein UT41_C0003G0086 [Candidatus Wolfebacteria bacterium GW2011_GWC2_39_22]